MFSKRQGFTLVELLIVIIVIGILAGGMMLASGSATESAKAATALSDLRNAKAAGIAWLADHDSLATSNASLGATWILVDDDGTPEQTFFLRYMDNALKAKELLFVTANNTSTEGNSFFLVGKNIKEKAVTTKLLKQGAGALYDNTGKMYPASNVDIDTFSTTDDMTVYMRVK